MGGFTVHVINHCASLFNIYALEQWCLECTISLTFFSAHVFYMAYFFTGPSPNFMSALSAVGAV